MDEPALTFTIDSDDDLTSAWTTLMGPWGFEGRQLWVIVLDVEDVTTPVIMPIDDVPERPDDLMLQNLHDILIDATPVAVGGSAAFLLSRPGRDPMNDDDRAWARSIVDVMGGRCTRWPVHFANDRGVHVFRPDDLAA